MASMYACSSFSGFVSSNRRWQRPPNSLAMPKLSEIDFAWPMWRWPLGSGGNRVTGTRDAAGGEVRRHDLADEVAALGRR